MANYYREKGKDKVYTKEDGKWRHVNYAEAKEKNIWKDVKEVKAGTLSFVTNKDMSVVRKLAAEKLSKKESTTTSSKSPYVKVKTLKDGNVIGYKEDGSWTLIKGRYVKRVTLKDGSVVGYKDDGNWELISKPEKKEEKYINKETKKV